jgi:hypothetical protein
MFNSYRHGSISALLHVKSPVIRRTVRKRRHRCLQYKCKQLPRVATPAEDTRLVGIYLTMVGVTPWFASFCRNTAGVA